MTPEQQMISPEQQMMMAQQAEQQQPQQEAVADPNNPAVMGVQQAFRDATGTQAPYGIGDHKRLADLIYGEVGSQNEKVMAMVGSSVLNRVESGRDIEFGGDVREVISSQNSPYYAASEQSEQFMQAVKQKFPDKISEKAYKKALQVAGGLLRGTIDRHNGMFFFEGKEVSAIKRSKKKIFDFKKVKETGKVGKYHTYSY